jgi:anaerobic nitric oxide reductase transcription regulator
VQAKLLRVLQSGQLQRLGSDREHRVDVRLIAATNRDLAEEVRNGNFRADFYHRLSVYPLRTAVARTRTGRAAIGWLFPRTEPFTVGLNSLRLSNEAQAALIAYDWPGNVRELEHLIGARHSRRWASTPTGHDSHPRSRRTWTCAYRRQCRFAALQTAPSPAATA